MTVMVKLATMLVMTVMPIMVNMVMAAMVLLLVTNNAGRGRAGESGDDDESGRDYVPTYGDDGYVRSRLFPVRCRLVPRLPPMLASAKGTDRHRRVHARRYTEQRQRHRPAIQPWV